MSTEAAQNRITVSIDVTPEELSRVLDILTKDVALSRAILDRPADTEDDPAEGAAGYFTEQRDAVQRVVDQLNAQYPRRQADR